MTFNRSHVVVLFFILLAVAATILSYRQIPHSLVVHINDRWHVMLVGESRVDKLNYHANDFVTHDSNRANLWLSGAGPIVWQQNHINVKANAITINDNVIATSHAHSEAHITLYPDGRISKGQLNIHN